MVFFSRTFAAVLLSSASSVAVGCRSLRSRAKSDIESRKLDETFKKLCTALIGLGVDNDRDPSELNQTWMACSTHNGMIHDLPEVCKEWVEDVSSKGELTSNSTVVNVRGAILDLDMLYLPKLPPEFVPGGPVPSKIMDRGIGDRKLLAVRVITTDGIPSTTEDQLRESLFTSPDSLTNQMSGCSQDKLTLHSESILALTGGPSIEQTLTMTPADCSTYGAGEEIIVEPTPGPANYTECPAHSYVCIGPYGRREEKKYGDYEYSKDFTVPGELPGEGHTKVMNCVIVVDDNSRKNIEISVHTYMSKRWFDFEMLNNNEFMISQVELGVGLDSENETIVFSYPYTEDGQVHVGGTVKTGVLKTSKDLLGEHREVTLVKLCVIPRSEVCANVSATTPRNAYTSDGKITAVDSVASYGSVGGLITVRIPYPNSAGENVIRNAITKKLRSIFYIRHPEELADFVMYCVPEGTMTRQMYAFEKSWLSVYSDKYCTNVAALMRGLGHNFGLGPARVDRTWDADFTGLMGDNLFNQSKRCYNAAKLAQTGWYDPEERSFTRDSPPLTFDIHGYVKMPEKEGHIKIVTFHRKNPIDVFLFYNWATDANAEADPAYANKIIISQMKDYGLRYTVSYRLAVLGEGETYFRKGFYEDHCDLNVTVNTIHDHKGISSISFTGCTPDQPTESPTPVANAPTNAPTAAPSSDCYAVDDLCETADDCCDGEKGSCLEVWTKDKRHVFHLCQ